MQQTPAWAEAFDVILAWYFQAIQPENGQIGKLWPIVANAVGTALERLSYTILVLEENDPVMKDKMETLFSGQQKLMRKHWNLDNISPTGKRLQLLLERIGLTQNRGFWDTNEVKSFLEVRNEATHPKEGTVERRKFPYLLSRATQ